MCPSFRGTVPIGTRLKLLNNQQLESEWCYQGGWGSSRQGPLVQLISCNSETSRRLLIPSLKLLAFSPGQRKLPLQMDQTLAD